MGRSEWKQNAVRNDSRRNALVFLVLVGSLGFTSVLLLALSPAPLTPDSFSLVAVERAEALSEIFETRNKVEPGRWTYIYVHHSKTAGGELRTPGLTADHFLIGNGQGCLDGELQISSRWIRQQAALPEGSRIDPSCISICLVGDFDQHQPTAMQRRRLAELTRALQTRLGIPANRVLVVQEAGAGTPAGIGRHFPLDEFRAQLIQMVP